MISKIKLVVFLLPIYFLISCAEKKNNEDLVKSWIGKEMVLPTFKSMERKTSSDVNPILKKVKIVTFIDGSCSICIKSLKEWQLIMKEEQFKELGYIFIISSYDHMVTFKKLNSNFIKLEYPYYYDAGDRLFLKNKIPDEQLFQTFLLDENNKVVLMGNPNTHEKIYSLYINEITKMLK